MWRIKHRHTWHHIRPQSVLTDQSWAGSAAGGQCTKSRCDGRSPTVSLGVNRHLLPLLLMYNESMIRCDVLLTVKCCLWPLYCVPGSMPSADRHDVVKSNCTGMLMSVQGEARHSLSKEKSLLVGAYAKQRQHNGEVVVVNVNTTATRQAKW